MGNIRTYEILGYHSQQDFDDRNFNVHDNGLTHKHEAMRMGKKALKIYPIVKVQTSDREFIDILKRIPLKKVSGTLKIKGKKHSVVAQGETKKRIVELLQKISPVFTASELSTYWVNSWGMYATYSIENIGGEGVWMADGIDINNDTEYKKVA